jgi:hypothetical protein
MERAIEEEGFSPPRCAELLRKFEEKEALPMGKKLRFSGVGENDVYNISSPFLIGGTPVIIGRVEGREARADSQVMFFEEKDGVWIPAHGAPTLPLEDGFATQIGNETIIGGVEVYPNVTAIDSREPSYRTVFYRGHDLSSLEKFAAGPDMMKDIRLASLANGRIGVSTRPQGGSNGRGKIGYVELRRLEDMTNIQNFLDAKIIEDQFAPEEWGGANGLHPLQDGTIGIIGHIAHQDEQNAKSYYAMSFEYNPETHRATPIEIIATRKNFPAGDAKTPELADIFFLGDLVPHDDGTGTLYGGLSDAEAGSIEVPDPFYGKRLKSRSI